MSDPYRSPPVTPYRAPGRPGHPCPRCEASLAGTEVGGVRVDVCVRCSGTFVSSDALRAILDQDGAVDELRAILPRGLNGWADRGRVYVKCPVCETLMNRRQYPNAPQRPGIERTPRVVVDLCKHHGIWFDAGELPRALDFIAAGATLPWIPT